MDSERSGTPTIDWVTLIGMTLLIGPATVVAHELGGHAAMCLAVGARLTDIGAFYVNCVNADGTTPRIVAMAGTFADILIFIAFYFLWQRAKNDLWRLACWLIFSVKGMVAAGYFLFSGATGLGDWNPGKGEGIGPLPHPLAWRAVLFAFGLYAYIRIVRLAVTCLGSMIGGGRDAFQVQRQISLGFYFVFGALAILIGLLNPVGIAITITSAAAATFGGTAGLITVSRQTSNAPPIGFQIRPNLHRRNDRKRSVCACPWAYTFTFALTPLAGFLLCFFKRRQVNKRRQTGIDINAIWLNPGSTRLHKSAIAAAISTARPRSRSK
jgi:hypothetical protein